MHDSCRVQGIPLKVRNRLGAALSPNSELHHGRGKAPKQIPRDAVFFFAWLLISPTFLHRCFFLFASITSSPGIPTSLSLGTDYRTPQTVATTSPISLGSTTPIISASDVLQLLPRLPSLLHPQQPLDFAYCCPLLFYI